MTLITWLYGLFIQMGSPVRAQKGLGRLQRSRALKPVTFAKLSRLVRNYYGLAEPPQAKMAS